ncbi:sensor histidine kinase [Rhodococcus maanshanensis]|uniref:histidine kinase n=1 Tax=Rhodococcus maanshanensis TaxID=183556 RepID=A0A1H7V472_9NOCA|nr:histidine kinase [Rhodococcus maanshanensis]SEM03615.1 Signal transduction histidine kinase [Rhodococcus maanshanensis]
MIDHPLIARLAFVALIFVAALDIWLVGGGMDGQGQAAVMIGIAALFLRSRFPVVAFVATLPVAALGVSVLIPAIAIYSVGRWIRRDAVVVLCVAALCVAGIVSRYPIDWRIDTRWFVSDLIFIVMLAAAPVLLGRLVASRITLQGKIAEITRAHEEGDVLRTETALARDRAQLAREMHDVVSHQVSLIAVQAGALEVSSRDELTADIAATIRTLSVRTLDELRHMITVLRASGTSATGLAPQPTVAQLTELVESSGLDVSVRGNLPPDLPAAIQRAIYRTVQEALTNVRKHAPGARVTVDYGSSTTTITVAVVNSHSEAPAMELPGSRHGLRGLTERAELLGGTLSAQSEPDGGFGVELCLPWSSRPH